jgi:superfamily II DNA or RNA helicase
MKFAKRGALISGIGSGAIEVLTSCDLISEGLDVPVVGAVILLRPTRSLVLHRQQIGRRMRPADGKSALVVNDHVGNCLVHGLPEFEPPWSPIGVARRRSEASVWQCPECEAVNALGSRQCLECGCARPMQPSARRLPATQTGELEELTREQLVHIRSLPYWAVLLGKYTEGELETIAAARNYRPGWVRHRLREQERGR